MSTLLRLSALLAVTTVTSACTLRFDFTECKADADCLQVEGGGAFYSCDVAANKCVEAQGVECRQASDCAGKGERTQCQALRCVAPMGQDMGQDMTSLDMPPDMMSSRCAKNSDCQARGTSFLCGADGQCFDALSEDCTSITFPKSGNRDDVVVVGALLPLVEPFGSAIGRPLENAIKFAQDQFNGEGGLADGRKIALVSCDTKGDAQVGSRAASHLVNTVKVPALIGPIFSEVFIAAASDVARGAGTFIISPTATSPAITNLHTPQNNTIWRNIASDVFQGAAFVERVKSIGVQRVLILYKDDKYGQDLQGQIAPQLINELGMANVKIAKYDNPVTVPDATERRQRYGMIVAQALSGFDAQATLILGTSEGAEVGGAYLTVVSGMGATPGKLIFSHGVVPVMPDFVKATGLGENILGLVEGVAPDIFNPADPSYRNFALAYNLAFGGTQFSLAATTAFDAAMTTFLAMSAIPSQEPITGRNIAGKIGRLVDKSAASVEIRFFVTDSYVSKAVSTLSQGGGVDLYGVSGALDYDTTTGSVYTRMIGWEVIPDPVNMFTLKQVREMKFPNAPMTNGMWTNLP